MHPSAQRHAEEPRCFYAPLERATNPLLPAVVRERLLDQADQHQCCAYADGCLNPGAPGAATNVNLDNPNDGQTRAAAAVDAAGHGRREEADTTCSQVFPGVWVGGADADPGIPVVRICLHEREDGFRGGFRIPIVIPTGEWHNRWVSRRLLDAVANVIEDHRRRGVPVLVHCWSGVERSPLAVAWWMKRHQHATSMTQAYEIIETMRPVVQRRLHWLGSKAD